MPDAFFTSTVKKRKRLSQAGSSSHKAARTSKVKGPTSQKLPPQRKAIRRDEELDSNATHSDIDDVDLRASDIDSAESDREEDARETPAEKRLRLAKIYLEGVKEGLTLGEGEFDAAEIDRDIISARLKEDVLQNAGKLHIFIAASLAINPPPSPLRIKGHRLAVTSAILSHDAKYLYMAGKEGGVSSCEVASGRRLAHTPKVRPVTSASTGSKSGKNKGKGKALAGDLSGHTDEVLALALSGDGKYLVSAGKDRTVGVWDVSGGGGDGYKKSEGLAWIRGFGGHKDTISALSFRKSTNMLYSASCDRTIKLFDLSPGVMGYVETLFGHQDSVTGLDSLKGDTAVTCGGRDRTCRYWKIADETQLVFRGGGAGKARVRDILEGVIDEDEDAEVDASRNVGKGKGKGREAKWVEGSVDCVAMVDEHTFISGGDSGSIALWSTNKKKPLFTYTVAHGLEEMESSTEGILHRPRWITSLACLRYSDLFVSGSWDGHLRLWKLEPSLRFFSPVGLLPAPGLINSLQLVAMPKGWTEDEAWGRVQKPAAVSGSEPGADAIMTNGDQPHSLINGDVPKSAIALTKSRNDEGVLLVAAIGQEPRMGRWIRLKGEGVVNSALVFALRKGKVIT